MSTAVMTRPGQPRAADGGLPARRAVIRWAWRLFWREWRQQLLILALITLAVAATIVGSAVATNTPPAKNAGFGTAQDSVSVAGTAAQTAVVISNLERRFGRVEVIENTTETIPGSVKTYELRSENPTGPFIQPMLALVSGRYPRSAHEVAVTPGVASALHLAVGSTWDDLGTPRTVVGIVENPESLLDEFALVEPGQVASPSTVTVLFDAPGRTLAQIGFAAEDPASVASTNALNPETISLAVLIFGMVLIALVSIGGFTVLAQRRLRSIGMLEATGATDRHVRLVVLANGTVVGVIGAALGFLLGLGTWLAYRPSFEQNVHHLVGPFALPWAVTVAAMALAVGAATFAASRPARTIVKVPIVQALSGRPAPPRQIHRSAVPGIALLATAFVLFGYAGGSDQGKGGGDTLQLALGIVLLVPGLILLAPFFLSLASALGRRAPIATRIALRDLARYRARSGSALAAISVGVLVSVIVMLAASARYGNVLDYAGPNLAPNQLHLSLANVPGGHVIVKRNAKGQLVRVSKPPVETASPAMLASAAEAIAKGLGARLVDLESPNAVIAGRQGGRQWTGAIYVATPQLLSTFGITSSQIDPKADVLTSRPGLTGVSGLELAYGGNGRPGPSGAVDPVIEEVGALPTGTSAPNTVITDHAMAQFHITATTTDWLVVGAKAFSAAQISEAELTASKSQLAVESKNDEPTSSSVVNFATIFGILVALGVLGMSVGLVRAETTGELRTLAATGASGTTRRALTAVTAGALGLLGAVLGVAGGYVAMIGWLRSNSLNGGISSLENVPVGDLLLLLLAMPAFAAAVGWLFAGREPDAMAHQALE